MKDGPNDDDFEPVIVYKEDENLVPASRYHWKLMTIWRDAVIDGDKINLTFSNDFHTPLIKSAVYTSWMLFFSIKPDGGSRWRTMMKNTARKFEAGGLYGAFQFMLMDEVSRKFRSQLPPYIITAQKFDKKYLYDLNKFVGGALVGINKEIPKHVLRKLITIYDVSFEPIT